MRIHRGRLIDHLHLVVADIERSRRFYRAVLEPLGLKLEFETEHSFACDELFVSDVGFTRGAAKTPNRTHLAFQAPDRESVDRFHRAALAADARDNGAPGERPSYHPGYYAAFVLDPDGNNVEAVYHGEARRSAGSVTIDFEMP
jgi:catechol 2,3-dioxygenase-like lactoylglutathione lyase family enzyme